MFGKLVFVLLFVVFGSVVIKACVRNEAWFFERSRAKSTVLLFGREGARVVYGLVGLFIIGLAVYMLVSPIPQ